MSQMRFLTHRPSRAELAEKIAIPPALSLSPTRLPRNSYRALLYHTPQSMQNHKNVKGHSQQQVRSTFDITTQCFCCYRAAYYGRFQLEARRETATVHSAAVRPGTESAPTIVPIWSRHSIHGQGGIIWGRGRVHERRVLLGTTMPRQVWPLLLSWSSSPPCILLKQELSDHLVRKPTPTQHQGISQCLQTSPSLFILLAFAVLCVRLEGPHFTKGGDSVFDHLIDGFPGLL